MSTRYPDNFKQDIDAEWLSRLPARCTYEGNAPDLQHLRGLLIETARVQDLIYVGERDNIHVVHDNGVGEYPWRGVPILRYDAEGKLVWPEVEPIVYAGKGAMHRADLGALGYTDRWLMDQALELLGETHDFAKPGPSQLRRSVYNRVLKKIYGQ